jgi:hypothetical protein
MIIFSLKVEIAVQCHIDEAIYEAIKLATKLNCLIEFKFQGIMVCVTQTSNAQFVKHEWLSKGGV